MITETFAKDNLGPEAAKELRETGYAVSIGFKGHDASRLYCAIGCSVCNAVLKIDWPTMQVLEYRGVLAVPDSQRHIPIITKIVDEIKRNMKSEYGCTHAPEDIHKRLDRFRILFAKPTGEEMPLILPDGFGRYATS